MLETGSRNEQTKFRCALLQEVDGTPEFVFADVVADDDLGAGLDDVADDRLEAGVPAWLVEARRVSITAIQTLAKMRHTGFKPLLSAVVVAARRSSRVRSAQT